MALNLCTRSSFRDKLRQHLRHVVDTSAKSDSASHQLAGGNAFDIESKFGGKVSSSKIIPLPTKRDKYTVYKLDGCPYSEEAGKIVSSIPKSKSLYIHADLGISKESVSQHLNNHTSFDKNKHSTFPIVFYGDNFIGGCHELKAHLFPSAEHSRNSLLSGGQIASNRTKYQRKAKSRHTQAFTLHSSVTSECKTRATAGRKKVRSYSSRKKT